MEKIILGTVQFGLPYGINNQVGQPSAQQVFEIFDSAAKNGISQLDTAEDYGLAQELIGDYHLSRSHEFTFDVISKLSHSFHDPFIAQHLRNTLKVLNIPSLNAYLFHNFGMYKRSSTLLDELVVLKKEGVIGKVGVSVYTNEEILEIVKDDRCDIIQIPFNLLDNNLQKGELLEKAKEAGKEIHIRSVYLQGLFFMLPDFIPARLQPLAPYLLRINNMAAEAQISLSSLALQYVYHNSFVDKMLIGVDSVEQLNINIDALSQPFEHSLLEEIDKIDVKESWLLNPVNWK